LPNEKNEGTMSITKRYVINTPTAHARPTSRMGRIGTTRKLTKPIAVVAAVMKHGQVAYSNA